MQNLATLLVPLPQGKAELGLYHGDLVNMPKDPPVDLLVVSAFPGDYIETSGSLMGALGKAGLHVEALASAKDADLRSAFGCWLSKELSGLPDGLNFRRIMCFEPQSRGRAPEVVGDLFRAITPFVLGPPHIKSIAMPLVAAGDACEDPAVMVAAIVDASVAWLQNGLPVKKIMIVERDGTKAKALVNVFTSYQNVQRSTPRDDKAGSDYDFFVSYAREDTVATDQIVDGLRATSGGIRIFLDRADISPGSAWQEAIWSGLERCKRVLTLLSPDYLQSKMCQQEFLLAWVRHTEEFPPPIIIPILLRETQLPLQMRSLDYLDCRGADSSKIRAICKQLVSLPEFLR